MLRLCSRVIPNPSEKVFVFHIVGCERPHHRRALGVFGNELVPIELEKDFEQDESDALVAVDERMVSHDGDRVHRGEIGNLTRRVPVRLGVARTRKGGLEQPEVSYAKPTSVLVDLRLVDRKDGVESDPASATWRVHARLHGGAS